MLTEGVTEGLSSAGSFGLGKVFDAVKGVFRGERTGYLAEAGVVKQHRLLKISFLRIIKQVGLSILQLKTEKSILKIAFKKLIL